MASAFSFLIPTVIHITSIGLKSDFAQGAEGAQECGWGAPGKPPDVLGGLSCCGELLPSLPGFQSPLLLLQPGCAWPGPVHEPGERQRQVGSGSIPTVLVLQAGGTWLPITSISCVRPGTGLSCCSGWALFRKALGTYLHPLDTPQSQAQDYT